MREKGGGRQQQLRRWRRNRCDRGGEQIKNLPLFKGGRGYFSLLLPVLQRGGGAKDTFAEPLSGTKIDPLFSLHIPLPHLISPPLSLLHRPQTAVWKLEEEAFMHHSWIGGEEGSFHRKKFLASSLDRRTVQTNEMSTFRPLYFPCLRAGDTSLPLPLRHSRIESFRH